MSHARTIDPLMMTNIMVPRNPRANILVSFPLNSTHPYERLGKHMRDEIYARCTYDVSYSTSTEYDRIRAFHGAQR